MSVRTERARIAALSRSRTPDDPDLVAARTRLKAAMLAQQITLAMQEPALTTDQRTELAALLAGGAR